MRYLPLLTGLSLVTMTGTAQAYIGPGMGAGGIAVVLGILAGIFLSLCAVVWYPLKRMFKRGKTPEPAAAAFDGDTTGRQGDD